MKTDSPIPVTSRCTVFQITLYVEPYGFKLAPYLMMPPCLKVDIQKVVSVTLCDETVGKNCLLTVPHFPWIGNAYISFLIANKIIDETCTIFLWSFEDDCVITLIHLPLSERFGKSRKSLIGLRKKNHPRCRTVKPVRKPKSVHMMERPHCKPGSLYNAMVYPCMPYTLSGFVWYQGENSIEWSEEYAFQLQNLIESWRDGFASQAPFLVGQLTNFNYPSAERAAMVRDAQLKAEDMPGVYAICTIDIGNPDDVHPDNKLPFGERFAGMALNKVYGKAFVSAAYPVAHRAKVKKGRIEVGFKRAKGLHAQGEHVNDVVLYDHEGNRLEIEKAYVDKNRLVVEAGSIDGVAKVSYAVDNDVKANLYNGNGLPAFPFSLTVKQ